jgi:hypothetical protein
MTLVATGAFAAVVNGALQVAQAVRDQFATRTNADVSRRVALAVGNASTTATGQPWNGDVIADYVDLATLLTPGGGSDTASAFRGVVFNGRDIFLIPNGNLFAGTANPPQDVFVSYNTTIQPFTSAAAYQTVALQTVVSTTQAKGFGGAALDSNGMLYFAPFGGLNPSTNGLVVRFDTSKLLSDTTAYTTFNVTQLGGSPCTGYGGACFDGRWVYFSPAFWSTQLNVSPPVINPHGFVVRYDSTQPFASTTSWTAINLASQVSASATYFQNCITDGQFVYFVPYNQGVLASFQIGQTLTTLANWTTVDLTQLSVANAAQLSHFGGATLVGRYLFLTPLGDVSPTGTKRSVLARFDTLDPRGVTRSGAWQTVDLQTVSNSTAACGYQGAITDGPYLYLVPAYNGSAVPPFLRYDTTQALTDSAGWTTMGGSTTTPAAKNLQAAFAASDGVYGYLGPNWNPASATNSGGFYRWRLWPGPADAQAGKLGQSLNFWRDSSGKTGFGTKQPAEQVHSASNIRADGLLLAQMGTSTFTAQAQTTPYATASQVAAGSSPYTLASYVLPTNALSAINKGVRIRGFGTFQSTSDTMYVLLQFGTQQLLSSGPINHGTGTGSWYLEATALLASTSPVSEYCGGLIVSTPPGAAPVPATSFTVGTQPVGSPITIAVQGSSTTNTDVALGGFSVDFIN